MKKYLNMEVSTVNKENRYRTYLVNVEDNKKACDRVLDYFNNRYMDVTNLQVIGWHLSKEDLKEMIYI